MVCKLSVVSTPDKGLAFNNIVYYSTEETVLYGVTSIIINGFAFHAKPHEKITRGCIGLSSFQRETVRTAMGQVIDVTPTDVPFDDILDISFHVQSLSTRRVQTKESDVINFVQTYFSNYPFTVGQTIIIDLLGTPLKLTVLSIGLAQIEEAKNDQLQCGILIADSNMEITRAPDDNNNKYFVFTKDSRSKKSHLFDPNWKFDDMGIGGMDREFNTLFRRAFASRIFPPNVVKRLGIPHVKGMVLFGPAGTGKTLLARQIGKMLNCRDPKIVNGPEILNKYVGKSEENIRDLFKDAEDDFKANGDAADLHLIILDEMDSLCKTRTGRDNGVGDSIVNQFLSKIDGVHALNNVLICGMTNRLDMIDPAILRSGRLEVHIEIGLPDEAGRQSILKIHTKTMRENGNLSDNVDLAYYAQQTENFTGAELAGLVRSATSFALYKTMDVSNGTVQVKRNASIIVDQEAFDHALKEVIPAFGVDQKELQAMRKPLIDYGHRFQGFCNLLRSYVDKTRRATMDQVVSIIVTGESGSGKSSIIASIALESDFPFVKLIRASQLVGLQDMNKCAVIARAFEEAYKSPFSCIILDGMENIIEYMVQRFNNTVLQAIIAYVSKPHPYAGRKLMIMATTNEQDLFDLFHLERQFQVVELTSLNKNEMNLVAEHEGFDGDFSGFDNNMPIKNFLQKISI